MFPSSLGLQTIEQESFRTPMHRPEQKDLDYTIHYRKTLSPRMQNFQRFFPKEDSDHKKSQKSLRMHQTYSLKMAALEQNVLRFRELCQLSQRHIGNVQERLKESISENQMLVQSMKEKEREISRLKARIEESGRKKIIKLKQKHNKIDSAQNSQPTSARTHYYDTIHTTIMLSERDLNVQNEDLVKKIKHLETERKYEQQRIKNATLSLQLDVKMKDQQIQRLQEQLQIYEKKFNQVIKKQVVVPSKHTHLQSEYEQWHHNGSQSQENKTVWQKTKCDLKLRQSTATNRKRHMRSGSSNLQEHPNRKREIKVFLKMDPKHMHKFI